MSIESRADIEGLRRAGRVVALTCAQGGVTTAELDAVAAGMPTISAGGGALRQDADGWTVRTRDGSLTAHAEHTVVVTRSGSPLVLTSAR